MEFLSDPTLWLGLLTLVVLEIVLGIDNLIFIAILADKLPPAERDRARVIGLSLALFMRLALLASLSWLVGLTEPLFTVLGQAFSGRDLILLAGGLFLLFKATMELHERLEGGARHGHGPRTHAAFGIVIAQIVALDAVFSLDSVITAVGMVDELWLMMVAVVIAIILMIVASKPLTRFVNAHPTVVVLCLGFLLMIGFSLIAEGFGMHIPKGYLYAAIGFSVLIEFFNQLAQSNRAKRAMDRPLRERTADAVLRMLGGRGGADADMPLNRITAGADLVFAPAERQMIRRVLQLSQRKISSLMTPRPDIAWLDLDADRDTVMETLRSVPHTRLLVARGDLDTLQGVVQSRDLLQHARPDGGFDVDAALTEPLVVHEGMSAMQVLDQLRRHPVPLAVVVDEYGSVEGLVTVADILAAIVGDLADTGDVLGDPRRDDEDTWQIPGALPMTELVRLLDIEAPPEADFQTAAGLALQQFGRIPETGEHFTWQGWTFEVGALHGRRVSSLVARRESSGADE
ncbi:MAG TPA: TerC family protein [Woeseiaceae bacterium]|nr:TerC family protein [Woeseiaceae bacterium]